MATLKCLTISPPFALIQTVLFFFFNQFWLDGICIISIYCEDLQEIPYWNNWEPQPSIDVVSSASICATTNWYLCIWDSLHFVLIKETQCKDTDHKSAWSYSKTEEQNPRKPQGDIRNDKSLWGNAEFTGKITPEVNFPPAFWSKKKKKKEILWISMRRRF